MTAHAQFLFKQSEHQQAFLYFVFFSTLASYNFHWYLTPETRTEQERSAWSHDHKALHLTLAFIGSIGAAYFSLSFLHHFLALGIAVFLTFLYSAPKIPHRHFNLLSRIAIGKTIYLAFVWTYVTGILPLILSEKVVTLPDILFNIYRYFFIYAICILFDYRDRENDRDDCIRSLITYLSDRGISRLFYGSLAVSLISLLGWQWLGGWTFEIVLLLPSLPVLAYLYPIARENFSDYIYYFLLDGLMAFPSLMVLLWYHFF